MHVQDTDGTLFNNKTLPPALWSAMRNFTRPGITFHSASQSQDLSPLHLDSQLFDPAECVVVRDQSTTNAGAFCTAELVWRSMRLAGVDGDMKDQAMWLTAPRHNGTSVVSQAL